MEFFGSEGQAKMDHLMNTLHNDPFIEINGLKVVKVDDIEKGLRLTKVKQEPLALPKSNVVKLYLEDGSIVTVRPSGTEPKVKFYVGTVLKEKPKDNSFPEALYKGIKEVLHL